MEVMKQEKMFEHENHYMYKMLLNSVITNLGGGRFHALYADGKEEALFVVKQLIAEFGAGDGVKVIGIGDSLTLHQINLFDWLYTQTDKYTIENPFERLDDGRYSVFKDYPNQWIEPEIYNPINRKVWECARRALLSDIFISGTNAVTRDGKILVTDGIGNRAAAMIYGPYKVILVVGRNKIVSNVAAGLDRIKNIATPWNNYRHYHKHSVAGEEAAKKNNINKLGNLPCVKAGYCKECNSPICPRHVTVIFEKDTGGNTFKDRMHIILVNDDLGC